MKCISVYTNNFEQFSDIYDQVLEANPQENDEDIVIEGITISGSVDVPSEYIERMRIKPEVVVMKDKVNNILILQHGNVFEICLVTDEDQVEQNVENVEGA